MIKTGVPVFFGCDVGKFSDSSKGIMDTALFDYEVIPIHIQRLFLSLTSCTFSAGCVLDRARDE